MNLLNTIPASLTGQFHTVQQFMVKDVVPVFNLSSGMMSTSAGFFKQLSFGQSKPSPIADNEGDASEQAEVDRKKLKAEMFKLVFAYLHEENLEGASQEALLCLKKGERLWGDWEDYDELVPRIAAKEPAFSDDVLPLRLSAFFGTGDMMIGKKGAEWIDHCFRDEQRGGHFDYESLTIPDSNHNSIVDEEKGVIETLCRATADMVR